MKGLWSGSQGHTGPSASMHYQEELSTNCAKGEMETQVPAPVFGPLTSPQLRQLQP